MHAVNITVSDLKVIFAVIDKRSSLFFYLITLISCKKYITNVKCFITNDCDSSMASYWFFFANVFAIDKRASLLMSAVKKQLVKRFDSASS
jgi:hypothetical protein